VSGVRIEAWDSDLLVDDFLGRVESTGEDGRFSIPFERQYFSRLFGERRPDLFFRVYRGESLLVQTPPLARNVDHTSQIDVTIELDDAAPALPAPVSSFLLNGTLRRADGTPAPPALVQAFEGHAQGKSVLGEALTDAFGRYAITCRSTRPGRTAGAPMRLLVEAIAPDGARLGEAASTVVPHAVEGLDIVLAGTGLPPHEGPGRVIANCRLELPHDDVVEQIEFERFFRLNRTYAELMPPAPMATSPDGDPLPGQGDGMNAGPAEANPADIRWLHLALYLPYAQTWRLQGYTRGRLVNSFALGPGEEQTVELFTWDRSRSALESTVSFEQEESGESSGSRRDTSDVVRDITHQTGFEAGTDGKVGFQVGVVNVDLKSSMSAKKNVSSAEKSTRASIVEATSRATQRIRMNRTLHVTESREYGREERVTRKLRNPNASHTLTVAFFEILANYRVTTALRRDDARLVVLIPSSQLVPFVRFSSAIVRQHETALRLALLDRALASCFDAARLVDARKQACAVLCRGCSCDEGPKAGGASPAWTELLLDTANAAKAASAVNAHDVKFPLSIIGAEMGAQNGIEDIKRYLMRRTLRKNAPRLLSAIVGLAIDGAVGATAEQVQGVRSALSGLAADALGKLAYDPEVSGAVWNEIRDAILLTLPMGDPISAAVSYGIACMRADKVKANCDQLAVYQDEGLVKALASFAAHHDAWLQEQQAAREADEKKAELARIAQQERDARILEAFGLRETVEAEERLQALLDHLNNPRNIDHYRFAVWNERAGSMDENLMSLALSGLIDPTPLGLVGDHLAVAVRTEEGSALHQFSEDCLAGIADEIRQDDRTHILPTAAMHSEAIVGQCSTTEPEALARQRLALWRDSLEVDGLALENRRLRARLEASPALLDREWPHADKLEVNVEANHPA
jgi:hypothetical protein